MPSWPEYKNIARERGALAKELYIVESMSAGSAEEIQKNLPDHLAYQKEMESAGKLVMAGPVSDPSGKEMTGDGFIVYRAASLEEAQGFADNDPMHIAGARTYKVRCWLVNEGSLSFNIRLSEQRIDFL